MILNLKTCSYLILCSVPDVKKEGPVGSLCCVQSPSSHKDGVVIDSELAVEVHSNRHRGVVQPEAEAICRGFDSCQESGAGAVGAGTDPPRHDQASDWVQRRSAPAAFDPGSARRSPVVLQGIVGVALKQKYANPYEFVYVRGSHILVHISYLVNDRRTSTRWVDGTSADKGPFTYGDRRVVKYDY